MKLLFIAILLILNINSYAIDTNNSQENINIVKINDELNIIEKTDDQNIWLTKYKAYLTYRQINNELSDIKYKLKRYSVKKSLKYEELSYKLKNRLKVKENELSLLSEFKDSPIGHNIQPKNIPIKPIIKNPFNILEAYSYIQKLKDYSMYYKQINIELSILIKDINEKINLYKKLFIQNNDPLTSLKIKTLEQQFKDFAMVIDIVSTTSNVYDRKIEQVILEVNADIKEEIARTIKLTFTILLLILLSAALKKAAKNYIRDDDNQYLAYKLINFSIIIIIVFIILFSYIENASYLVTVLGFASAGIAIALKDWFMSIFGWMAIMTSGAIKVGDRIKVTRDSVEIVGDVLDISLFKIAIREDITYTTYVTNRRSGRVFFVPNNYIFTDLISNYTYDGLRTVWDGIDITITFDSNHKKAHEIAQNITDAHAKGYTELAKKRLGKMKRKYILRSVSTEPRVFTLVETYGIVISTWYHTNSYATLGLRSTISIAILDAYKLEDDITIAYPTQTVNTTHKSDVKIPPLDNGLFDM
jgi:small-conductance mechanosensitive channel